MSSHTFVLWLRITIMFISMNSALAQGGTVTLLSSKFPGSRYNTVSMYDGDDTVYILGGDSIVLPNDQQPLEIFKLSLSSEKLEVVANFSVRESGGRGYWDANENIWYIGGRKGVWKFNPAKSIIINTNVTNGSWIGYNTPGFWNKREGTAYFFGGNTDPGYMKIYWELNNTAAQLKMFSDLKYDEPQECVWDEPSNSAYLISYDNTAGFYAKSRVYKYDPSTMTLVDLEISLPIWSQGSATVWDGTNVYIIGGFQSSTKNDVVKFNPLTKQVWVLKIDGFPATLYDASAVYVKKLNRIYVFGGAQLQSPEYPYGRFRNEIFYISLRIGSESGTQNEEAAMVSNTNILQGTDSNSNITANGKSHMNVNANGKSHMNVNSGSTINVITLSLVIFVVYNFC